MTIPQFQTRYGIFQAKKVGFDLTQISNHLTFNYVLTALIRLPIISSSFPAPVNRSGRAACGGSGPVTPAAAVADPLAGAAVAGGPPPMLWRPWLLPLAPL
jgi:hypothetical protein